MHSVIQLKCSNGTKCLKGPSGLNISGSGISFFLWGRDKVRCGKNRNCEIAMGKKNWIQTPQINCILNLGIKLLGP